MSGRKIMQSSFLLSSCPSSDMWRRAGKAVGCACLRLNPATLPVSFSSALNTPRTSRASAALSLGAAARSCWSCCPTGADASNFRFPIWPEFRASYSIAQMVSRFFFYILITVQEKSCLNFWRGNKKRFFFSQSARASICGRRMRGWSVSLVCGVL